MMVFSPRYISQIYKPIYLKIMSNRDAIINSNLVGGHGYLFIISVISFAIYGYLSLAFLSF